MALIGSITNYGSLQGEVNTYGNSLTGEITDEVTLDGEIVGMRGLKGDKGDTGDTGAAGADGQDGYSPSASVTKVGDTATITITDKDGTTTAEVHDGSGGGASAFIAEYGVTTYADVKDAYDEDAIIICTVDDSGNTVICQLAYYDDANGIFYFAQPQSDGFYLAIIGSDDTWDDGSIQFASTETATQLRDGLMSALDWQKLDGIESGAEVNVQSDWNEADSTDDAYIKNKPTIPSKTSDLNNDVPFATTDTATAFDAGLMSASDKNKIDTISWGAEVNVQSDWNEDDTTADDYIKNKPTIPSSPSDIGAQETLVSGTNIKTINNESLLGSGNISVGGGGSGEIPYCTCTDSASTVAKTATLVNGSFDSLTTGAQVAVKFTYTNTATNPTLNVNNTGAKGIRRGGTIYVGTNANESWGAGNVVILVYDGTDWQVANWLNTTYNGGTGAEIISGSLALNKVWSPQQIHDGILGLADKNVQSDWDQSDNTADDFIKNKPTLEVQRGTTGQQSVASNSYYDFVVTFSPAMSDVPTVSVSLVSNSTAGGFGRMVAAVLYGSVTKNGFTCRVHNGDTSSRAPYVSWVAIVT